MGHPAVYIVTGVVVAAAFVLGLIAGLSNKPQATGYGKKDKSGNTSQWCPPSSPPSSTRRRRSSPKRCNTCKNCGKSLRIKVQPCGHESLCRSEECMDFLENNGTCSECSGKIDSCSEPIPPFGKCKRCNKFKKLFKFLNCNHSLSLCISCFEEQNLSCKVCPECQQEIRGSEPSYKTSGVCGVCNQFVRFAIFQPCGHGSFCKRDAESYLAHSYQECSECGQRVTSMV